MPRKRRRCRIVVQELDDESPAAAAVVHEGVFCDACVAAAAASTPAAAAAIVGVRYSRRGKDYDLCAACYARLGAAKKRRFEALAVPVPAVAAAAETESDDDDVSASDGTDSESDESERDCATSTATANGSGAGAASLHHGEMPVALAQRTAAVRTPRFLVAEEIERLLAAHSALRDRCGILRTRAAVPDGEGSEGSEGRGNWGTTFLHTDGQFARALPGLRQKLLDLASRVDKEHGWDLLSASPAPPRLRCVELHTVGPGGSLPEREHYDNGSLITIDIMLSNTCASSGSSDRKAGEGTDEGSRDFEGGSFCTLECNGKLLEHRFERGDATVFVSHKYHCVLPVVTGKREVLVAEIWAGEERTCAHRCEYLEGHCPVSLALSQSADVGFLEYLSRFPHDPSGLLSKFPDGKMK